MHVPLAETLRPTSFSEVVGQDHLVGEKGFLTRIIETGMPLSILFFGPPGSGKTTMARMYARAFQLPFVSVSAVFNSAAELKKTLKENQESPLFHRQAIIFVDEIHRFNRAQQDLFLPFMEDGSIILIGATTENPSFCLNNSLLSRLRVLSVNHLKSDSLEQMITRYETLRGSLGLTRPARSFLIAQSQGDGRHLLNMIETLSQFKAQPIIDVCDVAQIIQKKPAQYDKEGEGHYNIISALHKSIRGSDPDAALYWFARMLDGGEEPLFIARRLIRVASEDIGLADPQALTVALNARSAYEILGSPEGELALAEAVIYLSLAPKSNALYTAYQAVRKDAANSGHLTPPPHICNAPTRLMEELGYGKGYIYDPDTPDGFSGQDYFPEELGRKAFYRPVERGFEREMKKRLSYFCSLRAKFKEKRSEY